MPTVIVTGSGGLIGSESVAHFAAAGFDVVGLEQHMGARFFPTHKAEAWLPLG
jgi:CDP-paratose 2-epimerase